MNTRAWPWLAAVTGLGACPHSRYDGPQMNPGPQPTPAEAPLFEESQIDTPPGMSDLSIDTKGTLWAIPERDHVVVEMTLGGKPITPIRHPLQGVPAGVDTEAIVALGDGKFALGIEGEDVASAGVLTAEARGDEIVVTGRRDLTDADVGLAMKSNHGVEALCGKQGELLAGIESVGTLPDGRRWAPIVRIRGDKTEVTRLMLTSDKGKISAMYCTIGDDGRADVTAIERHYGIVRILRFQVSREDTEVTPRLALDLDPILHDRFNLEGITRLPDGRYVVINDNQMATVSGPTKLLVFRNDAIQ